MSNKTIWIWCCIFAVLMFFTGNGIIGVVSMLVLGVVWIFLKGAIRGDYLSDPSENNDTDKWSQYYADGINHKGLTDAQARERAERVVNGTDTYAYSNYKADVEREKTKQWWNEYDKKCIERWEKGNYLDPAQMTSDLFHLGSIHYIKTYKEFRDIYNDMNDKGLIQIDFNKYYPAGSVNTWYPEEYEAYGKDMANER